MVAPSYMPGVAYTSLRDCLPEFVYDGITAGLPQLNRKLPGFDSPDAVLTGVETRSSSPVRIVRGDDMSVPDAGGVYPAGEGAGYAGGILSAAIDGIRAAEALMIKLRGTR